MSPEIKRGRLKPLIRRAQPEDLEAQVKALKELQPAFVSGKLVPKKKDSRFFTAFNKKWINILSLFLKHRR